MDTEPKDKAAFDRQMETNPRFATAYELLKQNLSNVAIAKELGITPVTLRGWFRKATLPKRVFNPIEEADRKASEQAEQRVRDGEDSEELLSHYSSEVAKELKRHASDNEDTLMAEIAEAQSTPADKYQHYIAAAGIKLLRDSIKHLKAPRTVRELSELDQLIRRNLGLNAKNSGGSGKMVIDISILNNGIADKGNGTLSKMKKDVVEAEVIDDEDGGE